MLLHADFTSITQAVITVLSRGLLSAGWLLYVLLGVLLAVLLRYATLAFLRKPEW